MGFGCQARYRRDLFVRKRPSDAFVFVKQNLACSVRCIQMFWAAALNHRFGCRPNHLWGAKFWGMFG